MNEKQTDCLFCRIVRREVPGKEIYRDDDAVAFYDINPKAPRHILIVPHKHIPSIAELDEADAALVGQLLVVARKVAEAEGLADRGYRIIINTRSHAGQEVDHLHVHLLGGEPLGPMRTVA